MPLSLNIGLSRKVSRNFQSLGFSINLTAELDQALLAKPDQLQHEIDGLYAQAKSALNRQFEAQGVTSQMPAKVEPVRIPLNSNGHSTNGDSRAFRPITVSQRRAIESISGQFEFDPEREAYDLFRVNLNQMTVRQASELIDHLKTLMATNNARDGQ